MTHSHITANNVFKVHQIKFLEHFGKKDRPLWQQNNTETGIENI